jgi:hypothetical protein
MHRGCGWQPNWRNVWSGSGPGHVGLHGRLIGFVDEHAFTKAAFPLAILGLKQVTLPLATADDPAASSDFEALGNCFPGFGDASILGHRGREISGNMRRRKKILGHLGGRRGLREIYF